MESNTNMSVRAFVISAVIAWLATITPVAAQDWVYTVVDDDTLWDLSEKYLYRVTHWKGLQRINNVKNPRKMQPGTRLRVPLKWIRVNPASAEVFAASGQAKLIKTDGTRILELVPKTQIQLGDQLETGAGTSIAVKLADGSLITVHEDSVICFDHLSAYGDTGMVDTRMSLKQGRTDTRVRPSAGPGSRFEIHTPSAISAVRGTEYRTSITQGVKASNIEVLEGTVRVKGTDKSRLVRAGFGTQVGVGDPPLPPRQLLDPPAIDPLPEKIRTLNWPITWQPLDGAEGYRTEVAATADFDTLLWQKLGVIPRAPFPDLPDGEYYFRVRGIDRIGLEGIDAEQKIMLDARPQPPLSLYPHQDEVFRGTSPTLRWTTSSEAVAYRLQVAANAQFTDIKIDRHRLESNSFESSGLSEPGHYYWRLNSIAADGELGPPGTVRSWLVKPIPERPEPALEVEKGRILASWREGAPGQGYQVQVAQDDGFMQLLLEKGIDQPQIELEPVMGQIRYLRVRIVEPDGYLGPWGATHQLDPASDSSWTLLLISAILGFLLL